MAEDLNQNEKVRDLKQRAEEVLLQQPSLELANLSTKDLEAILHDLQVHQIELEMQNEELRRTQVELSLARDRFFELYDLAPVGYLTLNEKGFIRHANLTLASLLGVTRERLINQPLSHFIPPDDQDIYYLHKQRLFEIGEPLKCHLRLKNANGNFFPAILAAVVVEQGGIKECRVTINDATDPKSREEILVQKEQILSIYQNYILRHEAERTKLARDLHDEILNGLVVLMMYSKNEETSPEFVDNYDALVARIRQIISGLRPKLINQSLWEALDDLIINLQERDLGNTKLHLEISETEIRYNPQIEENLYRIVQQACENAITHAEARNIHIRGQFAKDSIHLFVEDDGKGFLLAEQKAAQEKSSYRHFGVSAMYERAQLIGGELSITSEINIGTKINIHVDDLLKKQSDYLARIKAEQELLESEEKFRILIENANDGILIANSDSQFTYANQRLAEISGYTAEELLKIRVDELVHPDEYEKVIDNFRRRLNGEDVQKQYEMRLIHKNGETIQTEVTGAQTVWQGQPAVLGIFRDISERKEIETERLRNERDMGNIMDAANEGILISLHDETHVYANPKIAEITGYALPELLNTRVSDLIHPDEYPAFQVRKKKRMSGEIPNEKYQIALRHKNGYPIPVEISGNLITWRDQPATLGLIRDISDRQRNEADLRTVLDHIKDGIILTDINGNNLYANQSMAELTGYSITELVNMKAETLVPPDEYQILLRRRDNRLSNTPEPENYHTQLIHKDGHLILVESTAAFMHWQGKPAGIAFMREIKKG